jgi:uncharacterized protein (TIGR00369 family)
MQRASATANDQRRRTSTWDSGQAPYARLLGIDPAGPGRMAMVPAEFQFNPLGSVHGGVIATLLDAAMADAIQVALPPGRSGTRLEIKVNYLRALTEASGPVWAEATVVQAGRRIATATARLVDAAGRLYATASSTALVGDARSATSNPAGSHTLEWSDPRSLARTGPAMAGVDFLRAMAEGRLPPPPVLALLGITMDSVEPGRVSMMLPPGEHLHGPFGEVHGGMIATLLDSVMGCSVHSTLKRGRFYTTIEIKVNFMRAITAATGPILGTGTIIHSGHQVASAEAKAVDGAGLLYATASTACLLFDAS